MHRRLKLLLNQIMEHTPFDLRRTLPVITLDPLDLLLSSYRARGEEINIVQVGACDGSNNDPINHYVRQGMARAVLIEPNPFAFARLQKAYAGAEGVTLIQSAVGTHDGETFLYRVKKVDKMDSEVDLTLQVASFYREHLESHGKKPSEIEKIAVPCRSLFSLVSELGLTKIDLLQIDAEGFDAAVVRMALEMQITPTCINFEHIHLVSADRRPLFKLLKEKGYLLGFDAWNILAVKESLMQEMKGK
jgi:FkbM family methyltransferase